MIMVVREPTFFGYQGTDVRSSDGIATIPSNSQRGDAKARTGVHKAPGGETNTSEGLQTVCM